MSESEDWDRRETRAEREAREARETAEIEEEERKSTAAERERRQTAFGLTDEVMAELAGEAVDEEAELRRHAFDSLRRHVDVHCATVWIGGKLVVLWPLKLEDGMPRLTSRADARAHWEQFGVRVRGSRNPVNPFDIWFKDWRRKQYENLVFKPGIENTGDDYNLFRHWGVFPDNMRSCELFLAHLRDIICAGDEGLFDYVIQWLANIVQRPQGKPGTALVMYSHRQGTGKGTVFRYLRPIFEPHTIQLAGSELLMGRFNKVLANKLLVTADEAAWPGDKQGLNKLKSYITEPVVPIELKGIDAVQMDNLARFIIATNRDHAAPAELDDRRFVVLPVMDTYRDDQAYWDALDQELRDGGPAGLLHHLLHNVQLTRNLRATPKTKALAEQKLLNLDSVGQFWRLMLMSEVNTYVVGSGNSETTLSFKFGKTVLPIDLHAMFLEFCRRHSRGHPESLDAFGIALRRFLPGLDKRELRKVERESVGIAANDRREHYILPPLDDARKTFEERLGHSVDWKLGDGPETF